MLINFKRFSPILMVLCMCILCTFSCGNSPEKAQLTENQNTETELQYSTEELDKMIADDPDNSQLYYERALAYYESGDYSAALKDFDQTVALEPDFASALHDRGICRYLLEMFDSAHADFERAIGLDSTYFEAYFNQALVYDAQGIPKKALQSLNKAIEINPEFGDAYYNRGVYRLNSDPKKACEDLKKAAVLGIEEAALTVAEYCK